MNQYLFAKHYNKKVLIKELVGGNRRHVTTDELPLTVYESNAEGDFRTVDGITLAPHKFDTISKMNSYAEMMKGHSNFTIAGMRDPAYQYINDNYPSRAEFDPGAFNIGYFDIETARDDDVGYAPPGNPFNRVTLIQLKYRGRIIVWGDKDYTPKRGVEFRLFYDDGLMIEDFLKFLKFEAIDILTGWNVDNYDIPFICGRYLGQYSREDHHIKCYGKRYQSWNNLDKVTPFGSIRKSTRKGKYGKDEVAYEIVGLQVLDYLSLYKKFTYTTQENYTLNNIAHVELGEKKVDYSEFKHLEALYHEDYTKFVEYGIKDVTLIEALEEKMQLLNLAIVIAYMAGCNPQDVFSPVRTWEIYLYNVMIADNIITPWKVHEQPRQSYVGAYVRDPQLGKHEWAVSLDLASLYPHCYMFANMSPDTLIKRTSLPEDLRKISHELNENVPKSIDRLVAGEIDLSGLHREDISMTPNGAMFVKNEQGLIPKLLKSIYSERKEVKKRELVLKQELVNLQEKLGKKSKDPAIKKLKTSVAVHNAKQMALKIMMNSLYGASGNPHFNLFSLDIAEGITSLGQVSIKFIANKMNDLLNETCTIQKDRVIYGDTDSIYLSLEDIVNEKILPANPNLTDDQITTVIDKYCKAKILPYIDTCYEDLREYLNGYEQSMKMDREKIARSMVFVSKKRYFAGVIDDEGVRYPELKVKTTGLESVRSSTPIMIRKALEKLQKILLTQDEAAAGRFISEFRKIFHQMPIENIAIPKSVNDIEKWSSEGWPIKGSPQQVKASLLFNRIVTQEDPLAEVISSGDKVKLVSIIKMSAFDNEGTMAFPQLIPPELGLQKVMVNYDEMFNKTFLNPAEGIMSKMGWSAKEPVAVKLSAFFG